jgi:hypothetical protein
MMALADWPAGPAKTKNHRRTPSSERTVIENNEANSTMIDELPSY